MAEEVVQEIGVMELHQQEDLVEEVEAEMELEEMVPHLHVYLELIIPVGVVEVQDHPVLPQHQRQLGKEVLVVMV
jgi:hypothetical protein